MIRTAKGIRVSEESWKALRALTPYGETLDDTIQKLIRFYLNKPAESNKAAGRRSK